MQFNHIRMGKVQPAGNQTTGTTELQAYVNV